MSYTVTRDDERRIVELTYSGRVAPAALRKSAMDALQLAREAGHLRFLANCLGLSGGHSVMDLLGIVMEFETRNLPHDFREAVVASPSQASRKEADFYETACRNRGYIVRIFPTIDEARAWLATA